MSAPQSFDAADLVNDGQPRLKFDGQPAFDGEFASIGGLQFTGGKLVRWKAQNGRTFQPDERWKRDQPATRRSGRSKAAIAAFLRLPGVPFPPQASMPDGYAESERPEHKVLLSKQLKSLGVDGSAPLAEACANSNLPIRKPGPVAVAEGAVFLAGVSMPKSPPRRVPAIEPDQFASRLREEVRQRLSAEGETVLGIAITNATAREVGEKLGYRGKYAERAGVSAIDRAIDELRETLSRLVP